MKCRQSKIFINDLGVKQSEIVWFGKVFDTSYLLYCSNSTICNDTLVCGDVTLHSEEDNYVDRQAGIASSLNQRLSVIRGELWYAINDGLPLADKIVSKGLIDAKIASIIMKHPDVQSIQRFTSVVEKHAYSCHTVIMSKYGELTIDV